MPKAYTSQAARIQQSERLTRSIWKKDGSGLFRGLWDGPGSRLADVGSVLQSRYTRGEGISFWFDIERRPTEQYTLTEMRKLHRAIGRVLDKVEAEPKPNTCEIQGGRA